MGGDFGVNDVMFAVFVGVCFLTTLGFLRVVSTFRQFQVETHNAARDARRLRRGYLAKVSKAKDNEVISV